MQGIQWDDTTILSGFGGGSSGGMSGTGIGGTNALVTIGRMGNVGASGGPSGITGRDFAPRRQFGASGLEGAFTGEGVVDGQIEGENSDEYWNALIDGELGHLRV